MSVELLAPAGDFQTALAAFEAGADAVYCGLADFSARAFATNLTLEELERLLAYARSGKNAECRSAVRDRGDAAFRSREKKADVTFNTLLDEDRFDAAIEALARLEDIGPDGVIVQDLGVAKLIHDHFPGLQLHASTQLVAHNLEGVLALGELGFTRVVLARELSVEEIASIAKRCGDIELEVFIHGALCYSLSGLCLFGALEKSRSGNRGECAQPCRLPYGGRDTYPLSLKDLSLAGHIPELIVSGVSSLKIEGRMKTALYVATVARTYRLAIDDFLEDPAKYKSRIPFYKEEISKCTYRQYTTGFFFGKPDENTQIYDSNTYIKEYTYLGIIGDMNEEGLYHIEQRNKFFVGETIEVMKPDGQNISVQVKRIVDEKGQDMDSCPHPKQNLYIDLGIPLDKYDILRRQEEDNN